MKFVFHFIISLQITTLLNCLNTFHTDKANKSKHLFLRVFLKDDTERYFSIYRNLFTREIFLKNAQL